MQIFALANICRNRINYKLEITGLMGFHAIAVDRAIGFLSDRHHRTVSAWQNPPLLFHLSNIFFIQHFNFPHFAFFSWAIWAEPMHTRVLCSFLMRKYPHLGAPAQWDSPHWHSPGTITTLSSSPVNVQMWKLCVREGFKCGSSTEGSWSTQNKAQQPSGINEKPSQLMLFASMISSKRAFLQLNIFKETNGSCLNEFDCSFQCTQSLLLINI